MADETMFPIIFPREADEWMRETGSKSAQLICYDGECGCGMFDFVAIAGERHYRVVCSRCKLVQPELIGLHLGRIDGVS